MPIGHRGRHPAACARSGRLRTRAVGPERTPARICRDAGALVRCNTTLHDMNVAVPATDERAIEVLASGHPLFQGGAVGCGRHSPMCTDSPWIGLRRGNHRRSCPRTSTEQETRSASTTSSLSANAAVWWSLASKQEVDGAESANFVSELAGVRAGSAPPLLRRCLVADLLPVRWSDALDGQDGFAPDLADLFAELNMTPACSVSGCLPNQSPPSSKWCQLYRPVGMCRLRL